MKKGTVYSVDLTIHVPEPILLVRWDVWLKSRPYPHPFNIITYGVGKDINYITLNDWRGYIKKLFDWLRKKERKRKFIAICFFSKSHKGHIRNTPKPTVWHAHLLIIGRETSIIRDRILDYWDTVKRYNESKHCYNSKCYDDGKLIYNIDQSESEAVCISPAVTLDDLRAFGMDEDILSSIAPRFKKHRHIDKNHIIQMMYDFLNKKENINTSKKPSNKHKRQR